MDVEIGQSDNNGNLQLLKPESPIVGNWMRKKPRIPVDLTWSGLCVTVAVPQKSNSFPFIRMKTTTEEKARRRKLILNNVSGFARRGTLTAILGPSGSGKTTLLSALAHRLCEKSEVRGDIRINGWPARENILELSTLIPQQNLFFETLTTREHLEFMVGLRHSCYSNTNRRLRVAEILNELRLPPDSRIGDLSGGEKKRLIFASEIVKDPSVLFLDEPTTGLDTTSATNVISLLEELARKGRTVLCSIHQPSSKVFSAFNHLILLAEGRVAFAGKSGDAQQFFYSLGYQCPRNFNPADFYIQVLAARRDATENFQSREQTSNYVCDRFSVSVGAAQISSRIQESCDGTLLSSTFYSNQNDADKEKKPTLLSSSWFEQVKWLTWRSYLDSIRNPSVHMIRTVHKVMTSILIALCFAGGVEQMSSTSGGARGLQYQNIQGALFIFLCENNFPSCYAVLNIFPKELPIFLMEQRSKLYRTDTYYISKIISLIPGFVIEPFLFTVIAYWSIGLRPDFYAFTMTALIIIMTANVACAYGCFLSAAFESVDTSTLVMMPINQMIIVAAGFYVNVRTIPIYLNWIKYASWLMYSNEALTIIQWSGINSIQDCSNSSRVNNGTTSKMGMMEKDLPCVENGEQVIDIMGFGENNLSRDLLAVFLIFCGLHLLGFTCLWLRSRSARGRR